MRPSCLSRLLKHSDNRRVGVLHALENPKLTLIRANVKKTAINTESCGQVSPVGVPHSSTVL